MSRTIKYRVWDNENKSYDDPYSYAYYAMTQDGRLDFYCHGDRMDEADPDVYFIEQYTGLLDRNGEEIYEGDIVQIAGERALIVFDETRGSFMGHFFVDHKGQKVEFNDYIFAFCPDDIEVIGNIHENPELIGGEE